MLMIILCRHVKINLIDSISDNYNMYLFDF
jgi:hypothetical protein